MPASAPASILRRAPSQSPQSPRSPQNLNRSTSFFTVPRQRSTQDRIDEILETGLERANSMPPSSWSSGRSASMQPLPQAPEPDDSPDEMTGIMMRGNSRDYQSTETTSNPLSRRSTVRPRETDGHANSNGTHGKTKHWWNDHLEGLWSIELENKGSVARDHLALERTFLAWLRTSLAFASIGIAITQLFRLNVSLSDGTDNPKFQTIRHLGKPLGATFLGISILVLFLGYQRYFQSQQWIIKGKFPASRGTIILISLIALALMLISLIAVIVIQPLGSQA